MNKLLSRLFAAIFTAFILSGSLFSQFDNIDFLKSATSDGISILEAYIGPYANAFGAGLNGGWYNTAKPHKLGGFDLTVGLNVGMVPAADETFDLSTLGLSSNMSPRTGTAPTIAGPDEGRPVMTYSLSGVTLASFTSPPGTGWKYIPVPTAQIGIGLPLGTEIKGRFVPRIPIDEGSVMLWGAGLMHSIMQYIPGNELLPVDASLFGGYTRLMVEMPVSLQPGTPQNYSTYNVLTSFEDQMLSATVEAFNVSAIASVNLAVITFYGGLGYTKSSTLIKLEGNYPTPVLAPLPTPHAEYNDSGVKKGESFGDINIENYSGLRANIGFRLKLAVVTIHFDYTRAQYNVFSTGLGISFR